MQERITEVLLTKKSRGGIPIALIFPNDYTSAVANLGFNATFVALEKYGFSCERFFYSNGEVRSIEGNKNLRNFKIWAFSVSFELDVLNIFDIFSNLNVEPLSYKRKGNPFVIFGGCVASRIYNIVRFMPIDEVEKRISCALKYTDKVGLIGASVSDYPKLMDLLIWLKERVRYLSVSSLRVDAITVELLKVLAALGDREITLAPEGGTQHTRDVLRKELTADDISMAVKNVKSAGLKRVKLYFIYGLPEEKMEDLDGIIETAKMVKDYGIIPYVSLNPLEKSWEGNLSWRYIDISWKDSIFDELKISKEG